MPRTDAVQFFLELAAEWRRLGAEVTFEPGWERRGNGTMPAYEGGIVHHTGFVSSFAKPLPALGTLINGRPDLSGPLCNVAGPVCPIDRPRLHIMAAFPANHAGASGGRSMGPLPRSSLFNRLVVGLEIDYAGLTPMIGGQYRAALIFTRGLANVLRRSVEYIRAHAETSVTGKWDIGVGDGKAHTADMAAFRRDAAALPIPAPHSVPKEAITMRSVQLTADQPVAVLTVDPVGKSLVMPAGSRAWVQWQAFYPGNEKADVQVDWLVLTRAGEPSVPRDAFKLPHRGSGAIELPVNCNGVEIRVAGIPAGGVVGVHLDGLGHA